MNAIFKSGKELRIEEKQVKEKVVEEIKEKEKDNELNWPIKEYKPSIPYLVKVKKARMDERFSKFLELFKQFRINLPFVKAFMQMPKYAKFLKELLSNKRKLEELAIVTLSEECSAILHFLNAIDITKSNSM